MSKYFQHLSDLVQDEYDHPPQLGRESRLNQTFYIGDSKIEVAMTSDYQLLRLTVDLTYYTHNNTRTIKERREFGWTRGKMQELLGDDPYTGGLQPRLVLISLANELTEDYKVKP